MGGNVVENVGGMRVVKYGIIKDYVMVMRVVLVNGEIIRVGKKMIKDVVGFNVVGLMIVSEGCLGVIFEIILKFLVKLFLK